MSINTLLAIFSGLIGLCIGSFLNVVALRGLSGESIVYPPSKCPKCGKKLNWYTNIPVISYLFLGGKCQFCREKISLQYPIVEASNAILYIFAFLSFGLSLKTLFLWVVLSLFVLICITDFKERVVMDIHTYILIVTGFLYNLLHLGEIPLLDSVLGIAAGYLILEIMAHIGTLTVKTRAFGEGDTLIAMGIGALLGWKMLILTVFLSVIIQAVFAIPALFIKYIKNKQLKSAYSLIVIVVSIFALKFLNPQSSSYLLYLTGICTMLLCCLFIILKDLKNKSQEQNFSYMPFGPALVFAALLIILFQEQIFKLLSLVS